MSNNIAPISRIDSQLIGQAEASNSDTENDLLEAEAEVASQEAGMQTDDIRVFKSRTTVGRFVSTGMSGYVVGNTLKYQRILDACADTLLAELGQARNAEARIRIADAIGRLANSVMMSHAVQLKAVEIVAQGKKKKSRESNAPQVLIGSAGAVQVNGA